jgi:hypothetical protein
MPFASAALYRVQTKDGTQGVKELPCEVSGFARAPATCPIEEAKIACIGEARQLAKWARSYGIDACCRLHKQADPKPSPLFTWPDGSSGIAI